ncbi:hypothetical protein LY90DRAFT_518795 [Neocallimastix californiae]|uniref:Uncharacterized protein n=1 Tax=Neocallimastix californiae TaxID=1754190 RepID=A0A1Y1ZI51_9FUNG|nr:hypothetical protein LY90DRAFT_518795 [Neocallimastix californiae]|eukprot:ORY09940.1 hypothetical protein LY90DRAFT_518795 [Neocallimastix californiae]
MDSDTPLNFVTTITSKRSRISNQREADANFGNFSNSYDDEFCRITIENNHLKQQIMSKDSLINKLMDENRILLMKWVIYKNLNDINYIPSIIPNLYDVENNTVEVNHHSSSLTINIHFNTFVNQCKRASPRLNILYINDRGFSKYKQKYIFNCLLYIYDIILISETWFINYIELFKNPNLLASSPIKEKRGK